VGNEFIGEWRVILEKLTVLDSEGRDFRDHHAPQRIRKTTARVYKFKLNTVGRRVDIVETDLVVSAAGHEKIDRATV
jgi:hypothetical protein